MTDWREFIATLKRLHLMRYGIPLTNYKIGQTVGLDHSQVEWLETKEGAEPRESKAKALREMLAAYEPWDTSHSPPQIEMRMA